MENKLRKAIRNNNGLYEAIFRQKDIKFEQTEAIWYCLEKTPRLYSNLVTLAREWVPDEFFRQIDSNYENEKWEQWSIKDSFSELNLTDHGFEKLFDAQWIYLDAAEFIPTVKSVDLNYKIVSSEDVLSDWRIAWDSNTELGREIFSSGLLVDEKVYFVAGYRQKEIVSGCFLNGTEDVLGISNFFVLDSQIEYWAEMIKFIFDSIGQTDVVGYERKETVSELQRIGFRPVGDLTVWLKKRNFET